MSFGQILFEALSFLPRLTHIGDRISGLLLRPRSALLEWRREADLLVGGSLVHLLKSIWLLALSNPSVGELRGGLQHGFIAAQVEVSFAIIHLLHC